LTVVFDRKILKSLYIKVFFTPVFKPLTSIPRTQRGLSGHYWCLRPREHVNRFWAFSRFGETYQRFWGFREYINSLSLNQNINTTSSLWLGRMFLITTTAHFQPIGLVDTVHTFYLYGRCSRQNTLVW